MVFLFLISFLNFNYSFAEKIEPKFQNCEAEARKTLSQWSSLLNWSKLPEADGSWYYFTPTKNFGVWVVASNLSDEGFKLSRIEYSVASVFSFQKGNCRPELKIEQRRDPIAGKNIVSDSVIEQFIKNEKNGYIFTWSPSMPLSIDGVNQLVKASKKSGFSLLVVLDQKANLKRAQKISEKNKWPFSYTYKSNSVELKFRNMFVHFPSALMIKDGKISKKTVPGFKFSEYYENEFKAGLDGI